MSVASGTHRRLSEHELLVFRALARLEWQPKSLDRVFIDGIARHNSITTKGASRLRKLAARRFDELPRKVAEAWADAVEEEGRIEAGKYISPTDQRILAEGRT